MIFKSIEKMNIKTSVLDYIRYKRLNWCGHVRRINEERLSQKILERVHLEEEKGIPRNSWMQEVTRMRERVINNMQWIDREEWRRKIKF